MEPVYHKIEFCRDPETLWSKLREGRWDWLGVHPKRQFVLGSPRRGGVIKESVAIETQRADVISGEHGTRLWTDPANAQPESQSWFADTDQARTNYESLIARYEAMEGPLLIKIELIEANRVVAHHFVVKRPSTYDWRPAAS